MAKEIELKLSALTSDLDSIIDWLTKQHGQATIATLGNVYFDSPEGVLSEQKVALRIRSQDNTHTMTLKTAGQASAGIHQRQEYDWPLAQAELDRSALSEPLPDIDWQLVTEQFGTHFCRHAWLVEFQHSEIEVVVDQGKVQAGAQEDEIHEIELELKSGLASELYDFANRICRQFALLPNNVSKAQRGYRLLSRDTYLNAANQKALTNPDVATQLNAFTDALEWFGFNHDVAAWQQAAIALANLRMLSITQASSLQGDCLQLLKLCQPILNILPASIAPQSKLAQLKSQHDRLISNPELGQTIISIAQGMENAE